MHPEHQLVAILPCNDLAVSEEFYRRLGFIREGGADDYRMLTDGRGARLHLTKAVEGWLVPGKNPFAVYLYAENVDELAREFGRRASDEPWGMYEFSMSDPDETNVRVGWPSRMRTEHNG